MTPILSATEIAMTASRKGVGTPPPVVLEDPAAWYRTYQSIAVSRLSTLSPLDAHVLCRDAGAVAALIGRLKKYADEDRLSGRPDDADLLAAVRSGTISIQPPGMKPLHAATAYELVRTFVADVVREVQYLTWLWHRERGEDTADPPTAEQIVAAGEPVIAFLDGLKPTIGWLRAELDREMALARERCRTTDSDAEPKPPAGTFATAGQLAAALGLSRNVVDTRLRRMRGKDRSIRTEVKDVRRGEERYQYRIAAVWPQLIQAQQG